MTQTLSEPIFEINPDSDYFKQSKAVRDANKKIYAIIDEIAEEYGFDAKEFPHYDSGMCGFLSRSEGLKKFQSEVTKNSDRNGVHTFKKNSKMWKEIQPRMKQVAEYYNAGPSPFALIDIVGMNNSKYTQWVAGRMFIQVKDREHALKEVGSDKRKERYSAEPLLEIPFKEYLALVMETIED